MPIFALDVFGRASLGTNWISQNVPTSQDNTQFPVAIAGGFSTQPNKLGMGFAHWVGAGAFSTLNQYSRTVIQSALPSPHDAAIGVGVQISSDGQTVLYIGVGPAAQPAFESWKIVAGAFTLYESLTQPRDFVAGDVIVAFVYGHAFMGFLNGAMITLDYDAAFVATGVPGIHANAPFILADAGTAIVGGQWDAGSFDFHVLATEDFNRPDGDLGPNWTDVGLPVCAISSSQFVAATVTANSYSQYVPSLAGTDNIETVQITVVAFDTVSGNKLSPSAFLCGQGNNTTFACYRIYESQTAGTLKIDLITAGGSSTTNLFTQSGLTCVVGDTLMLMRFTGSKASNKNLLYWSQDFEKSNGLQLPTAFVSQGWTWFDGNSPPTYTNPPVVVVPNAVIAPDSTLTADQVTFPPDFENSIFQSLSPTIIAGQTFTYSFYARADVNITGEYFIDLGTFDFNIGNFSTINITTSWQRFSLTVTFPLDMSASSTPTIIYVDIWRDGHVPLIAGHNVIYMWGAQLELASSATTYEPTTPHQVLSVLRNGAYVGQVSDNTLIAGSIGISVANDAVGDAFSAGNMVIPPLPSESTVGDLELLFIVDYQIRNLADDPFDGVADTYRKNTQTVLVNAPEASNSAILEVMAPLIPLLPGESIDIVRVYPMPVNRAVPFLSDSSIANLSSTNLLFWSQDFDQSNGLRLTGAFVSQGWVPCDNDFPVTYVNPPVVTPNAVAAPNGTLTADKITFVAGITTDIFQSLSPAVIAGQTFTYSVYLRADSNISGIYYLDIGTFDFAIGNNTVVNLTTSWQRFSFTFTFPADLSLSSTPSTIYVDLLAFNPTSGQSSVYMWGAQLEYGSIPTTYAPTNTPNIQVFSNIDLLFVVDYQIHLPQIDSFFGVADIYRRPPQTVLVSVTEVNNSDIQKLLDRSVPLLPGEKIDILRVYPTTLNGALPFLTGIS